MPRMKHFLCCCLLLLFSVSPVLAVEVQNVTVYHEPRAFRRLAGQPWHVELGQ